MNARLATGPANVALAHIAPPPSRRWLLTAICLATVTLFAGLYLADPALYESLLNVWGFTTYPIPFIDALGTTAPIACWQKGIDVYAADPCDLMRRPFFYSPVWLRMSFLPTSIIGTQLLAIGECVLFAVSLAFLPAFRSRLLGALMIAATLSPVTLFALERGNPDLIMFVLTVVGLALLERSGAMRVIGYLAFATGGALKFYPFVLLGLALREGWKLFVPLSLGLGTVILAFFIGFSHEIHRAVAGVTIPFAFSYGFWFHQTANGIALLLRPPATGMAATIPNAASFALLAVAGAFALMRAHHPDFRHAFAALEPRERNCLIAGSLLYCLCFVAGPNFAYRAIMLLLTLPGLVAMGGPGTSRSMAMSLRRSAAAIVLAMWNLVPIYFLGITTKLGPFLVMWLVREALWWLVFTALLSVAIRFVLSSPVMIDLMSVLQKNHRGAPAQPGPPTGSTLRIPADAGDRMLDHRPAAKRAGT